MTPSASGNTPPRTSTHYALRIDPSASGATCSGRPRRAHKRRAVRVGDVLGSYRLVELIGHGSMGCVYRAEHVKLGRTLAIKVLHPLHARRRDAVARLFQEARAASQIRHPNIVEVIDYLEIDRDTVCVVMEHLPGPSLGRLMRSPAGVPAERALDILAQICDGLAAAHAAGIVHRDLKPDNVIVLSSPGGGDLVKIVDFGLAKLLDRDDGPRTAAGQVFGTPPYFSPEQATGQAVDGRADMYSLGAIAYELFAGRPPFRAGSFGEYVLKHATAAPRPIGRAARRPLPHPALESLIMRCLEKNPAARHQSAGELATALRALQQRLRRGPSLARRAAWSILVICAAAVAGAVIGATGRGADRPRAAAPSAPAAASASQGPRSIVRLISEPPAQVFRRGRGDKLCETPCALAISPGRDRSARAVFVMRRRGYRDQSVAVDPSAPPDKVRVRLERKPDERRSPAAAPIGPEATLNATLNPYRDGIY